MFANFATAIPTGAAATFILLLAMQSLISMQPDFQVDTSEPHPLIFLRDIPKEEIFKEQFAPIELAETLAPPPQERLDHSTSDTNVFTIPIGLPVPTGSHGTLNDPFTHDGPLMVIVRVEPTYPTAAAHRGLEGFVVVQFDVLSDGTVGNISIVSSSSSVFERSAIRAASRFRFKARVVDGVPQTSSGVQYQFRFKMDN